MTRQLALRLGLWLCADALPILLIAFLLYRRRPQVPRRTASFGLLLGGLLGALSLGLERAVVHVTLGATHSLTREPLPLLVAVGFIGPVEEALKFAAVWPAYRARRLRGPLEAIVVASAAATGLLLVKALVIAVFGPRPGWWLFLRFVLAVPMQLFLAASWGYVLGRSYRRATPRRGFFAMWVGAALVHGLFEHLLSLGTRAGYLSTAPLLLAMGAMTYAARRDLTPGGPLRGGQFQRLPASLGEIREAFGRRQQPVSLAWIVGGAFVNQGVLFALLFGSVWLGHKAGIDFAAVDSVEGAHTAPLLVLAGAAALAFPLSGLLIARASAAPSMLEPALSATLSLLVLMVVLGAAAPVGLAFALACAPIALVLACAGAWVGIGR